MAEEQKQTKEESKEANKKKTRFKLDVIAAIVLSLATAFGAWAAYKSAIWGGNCVTYYTYSSQKNSEVNTANLENEQYWSNAMQERLTDFLAFNEYEKRLRQMWPCEVNDIDETELATFYLLLDQFSTEFFQLIIPDRIYNKATEFSTSIMDEDEEEFNDVVKSKINEAIYQGLDTNYSTYCYVLNMEINDKDRMDAQLTAHWEKIQDRYNSAYKEVKKGFKHSEKMMKLGQKYNTNGDYFTLLTVFFTIVLFFAGLATTLESRRIKVVFVAISLIVFVITFILMIGQLSIEDPPSPQDYWAKAMPGWVEEEETEDVQKSTEIKDAASTDTNGEKTTGKVEATLLPESQLEVFNSLMDEREDEILREYSDEPEPAETSVEAVDEVEPEPTDEATDETDEEETE